MVAPSLGGLFGLLEDHVIPSLSSQVVADCKSGLPTADNDRVRVGRHGSAPCRGSE